MIIDKLKNIDIYKDIIPKEAIDFIKNLSANIPDGRVTLSDNIYANIEEYKTKSVSNGKFETHDKYIDIQILLCGRERIFTANRTELTENAPYNAEKDITFYKDDISKYPSVLLDGTNFVMLYPHEAHAPQITAEDISIKVKKIVIKVKV